MQILQTISSFFFEKGKLIALLDPSGSGKTTIRTYLTQLQEKGLIELHTKGKYSYINALVSEDGYRENLTEQLVDEWYDGSALDLVANLYKDEKLTEEDKQKLRRMLDELDD